MYVDVFKLVLKSRFLHEEVELHVSEPDCVPLGLPACWLHSLKSNRLMFLCCPVCVCMRGHQRSGINSSDVEVLTLSNVTEDDAGEYTCKVSNYIGDVSQSGWLTVIPGNGPLSLDP